FFEFAAAPENSPTSVTGQRPAWTAIWSHREASSVVTKTYPTEFYGTRGMLGIDRKGFVVRADKKIPPENHVPRFTGAPPVGGVARVESPDTDELWTTAIEDQSGNEAEQFT